MTTRRKVIKALTTAPILLPVSRVWAQDQPYPARRIEFIVGFPPGQASDTGARFVGKAMGEELHQTVIVINKTGAAGIVAHQSVKHAPADGYTLLYGSTGTLAINPSLYRNLPYEPLRDFTPVVLLNASPMFLTTATATAVNSLKEFLEFVKARPGEILYGSSGNGTTQHIAMEMLKKETGLEMTHVPFKGSAPMLQDLIAGRVHFALETSTAVLPLAQGGLLKLLGVTTATRAASNPNIATLSEQGLPGFEAMTWAGILAPAGTPDAIVERLNAAANRALQTNDVLEYFAKNGSNPRGGSASTFAQFMKAEIEKWGNAVASSGAHID